MAIKDYFYRALADLDQFTHDLANHSPIDPEDRRVKLILEEVDATRARLQRYAFIVDDLDKLIGQMEGLDEGN